MKRTSIPREFHYLIIENDYLDRLTYGYESGDEKRPSHITHEGKFFKITVDHEYTGTDFDFQSDEGEEIWYDEYEDPDNLVVVLINDGCKTYTFTPDGIKLKKKCGSLLKNCAVIRMRDLGLTISNDNIKGIIETFMGESFDKSFCAYFGYWPTEYITLKNGQFMLKCYADAESG
jgi:hypothetical protein